MVQMANQRPIEPSIYRCRCDVLCSFAEINRSRAAPARPEAKKRRRSELLHGQESLGILRPDLRDLEPADAAVEDVEHPVRLITRAARRPIYGEYARVPGFYLQGKPVDAGGGKNTSTNRGRSCCLSGDKDKSVIPFQRQ